jgi:nucleoside-diphosphate-sugar epimerase
MATIVIGGAGFIGRRVVPLLVERGEEVVVMDVAPRPGLFAHLGNAVRVVRGDVAQFDDVVRVFAVARPGARVLTLANTMGGPHPAHLAFRLNVQGLDNVLEAARLSAATRVAFASSLAVSGAQHHFGFDHAITEEDPTFGTNQYAAHKIFNEEQARDYRERHGLEVVALRPANVSGVDKVLGSMDHVRCITEAARGEPVHFPYGDAMRCPIHVDEVAEAFTRLLLADRLRHVVYNTGGEPISLAGIAALVRELVPHAEITFEHETGGTELENNPMQDCWLIDNTRLVEEHGVTIRPFREQVAQIVADVRVAG